MNQLHFLSEFLRIEMYSVSTLLYASVCFHIQFKVSLFNPLVFDSIVVFLLCQLVQERRRSSSLAQALQHVKEQHFTMQQQVNLMSSVPGT